MPFKVDKKIIFPVDLLAGPFVNMCEVEAVVSEDIQYLAQCTSLMCRGEHKCSFVISSRWGAFFPNDKKSCDIVDIIFNIGDLNFQAI